MTLTSQNEDPINNVLYLSQNQLVFCVITAVSLIGQAFTIVTYYGIRNKNNKFYAYVAWHSILGFPWLLSNYPALYYAQQDGTACKVFGFLNTFLYMTYMLWNSVVAWVIYSSLKHGHKIDKLQWQYIPLTYFVSFVVFIPSIIGDGFGASSGNGMSYCWYRSPALTLSMAIGFYIPLVASTLFNFVCYCKSAFLARKICSEATTNDLDGLFIFPAIQGVCNSGAILKKLAIIFGTGYNQKWEIVHIILAKGQGVFEALAYFSNKSVRNEVKKAWFTPKYYHKSRQGNFVEPSAFDSISIENEVNEHIKKLNQPIL
jgi:hypothetical protein